MPVYRMGTGAPYLVQMYGQQPCTGYANTANGQFGVIDENWTPPMRKLTLDSELFWLFEDAAPPPPGPPPGPSVVVTMDGSTMTGWQQQGTDYSSNGTDIVKTVSNFAGPLMMTQSAYGPDMGFQTYFPSVGQNGWDHWIAVRMPGSNLGPNDMNGYVLDTPNVPSAFNISLHRVVAGVWTSIASWPSLATPTTNIMLYATTTDTGDVLLEAFQFNYITAEMEPLGEYTDSSASKILTGTYGGVGSYFPVTVEFATLYDIGGAAPAAELQNPYRQSNMLAMMM